MPISPLPRRVPAAADPMHDIAATLDQLKHAIHTDFPAEVGAPVAETLFAMVTNFFRNGPQRKVFVFASDGIDFQYHESVREGDDTKLELAMFDTFNSVLEQAERVLGAPLGHRPLDRDSVMDVKEYHYYDEGDTGDGTEWTPEYEQGALLCCDEDRTRFWFINGRYIFVQGGYITADDMIVGYVAMTITPKLGDGEPVGEWFPVKGHLTFGSGTAYLKVDENAAADPATIEDLVVYWPTAAPLPALLYQLTRLQKLTLASVDLQDLLFPFSPFAHLREIFIEGKGKADHADGGPALRCVRDLIAQALPRVTSLAIRGFGNDKGDALALADLSGISQWRSLTSLGLAHNQFTFTVAELNAFIGELRQLPLETLDLVGNDAMARRLPGAPGRTCYALITDALPGVRVRTSYF